jgi:hypothetical protein
VPISGIRLSDWFHRKAHGVTDQGRRSRRSTPLLTLSSSHDAAVSPSQTILTLALQYDVASCIALLAACGAWADEQHRLQVLAWYTPAPPAR